MMLCHIHVMIMFCVCFSVNLVLYACSVHVFAPDHEKEFVIEAKKQPTYPVPTISNDSFHML